MKNRIRNMSGQSEELRYSGAYQHLAKDRTIFLFEDVEKHAASCISALLLYYDSVNDKEDITIYINTCGGNSDALISIYDVMQLINSPVRTVCVGKAYSAGSIILAAGTKGKRIITKNSKVMIHGIQCAFPPEDGKKVHDNENYFSFVNRINDSVLAMLSRHSNKTFDKVKQDCESDVYLDANEALAYGLVDTIV